MQLSIVKCSQYKPGLAPYFEKPTQQLTCDVEVLGPICADNVSSMRNFGAKMAKGEWLFFVDADCDYSLDKIQSTLRFMKKNNLEVAGGIYKQKKSTTIQGAYHWIQRNWVIAGLTSQHSKGFHFGRHLLGGCLLVSKKAFNDAGGFNENIGWGGEETEFVKRLRNKGYLCLVSTRLPVKHQSSLKLAGFLRRAWVQNFNKGYYSFWEKRPALSQKSPLKRLLGYHPKFQLLVALFALVGTLAFYAGTCFSFKSKLLKDDYRKKQGHGFQYSLQALGYKPKSAQPQQPS